MKVIFIKDLKKQGKINEIKEVSDGYATNFLIKNGYAVKYTKTSSNILEETLEQNRINENKAIEEAKKIKEKLEKKPIVFPVKANKGKVFGSISSKQIHEKLQEEGYKIDKKNIKIDQPLSILGTHNVKIELHKKVIAEVKVNLVEK